MDWFERITGFKEESYAETKASLSADAGRLRSLHNVRTFAIGELEIPSLAELRQRTAGGTAADGAELKLSALQGDARRLHCQPLNRHALFQVASQFNLLEMPAPDVTPEQGVTGYQSDRTQGPACAIAAGAATIYRNYLVPVAGGTGQSKDRQIDCLADLGRALGSGERELWTMRNGYAICSEEGLAFIDEKLAALSADGIDQLRGLLRIGLQWNVEVTEADTPEQQVSQALCSALPVALSTIPPHRWQRFGTLVLEAAYEATLRAAVLNLERTGCPTVFLTSLGGGAFGNPPEWIEAAIAHAVRAVRGCELDVRVVSFGGLAKKQALPDT
jgi:GNAT superfamily N-acetyltransferase